MAVRVAINGFGRIGRLVFRAAMEHASREIEIVGINDLGSVETNAHLLRYDSVHGRYPHEVTTGDNWLDAGRGKVRVTAERDPAKLPWRELGVDGVARDLHLLREPAVHGIVAEQVRVGLDRPEIVQPDDFDVAAAGFDDGAENVTPDAAEAVDANPEGHGPTSMVQNCVA